MAKTLRQLAADPTYMTPLDVRRELIKATDEYNDYMTRSVGGRSGHDWHLEWEQAVRGLMKEKDLKIREEGLRDLSLGEKFGKHFKRMTELQANKRYWDRLADRMGSSNVTAQLDAGVMPDWRKRMEDPHYDDPDKALRKRASKQFVSAGVKPMRGGNELYKGLV